MPADYGQKPWSQEAGPTAFAPSPQDTEYFGDAAKQWMINFRVNDLDAVWWRNFALRGLTLLSIRKNIRMGDLRDCMIQREIQSSYGNRNKKSGFPGY